MIGERLKQALSERGMMQKDLAEKAGVTAPTVSRWIGESRGAFASLKAVCEALDVSADWLLDVKLTPKPNKDAADLDAIRRACKDYMLNHASVKDTMVKIILVAMNGNRG